MRKRIKIIYTGGTIGGDVRGGKRILESNLNPKVFFSYFNQLFPKLSDAVEILGITTPVNKFSEDMIPGDWTSIAKSVYTAIQNEGAEGVIIAHGTDTLAYTASALSFMLRGLKVPVVVTGSNIPLVHPDTDARRNVADAIFVTLQENFKGVFVVFSGDLNKPSLIHLGTRARKKSFVRNAFVSVNVEPIGFIVEATRQSRVKIINSSLLSNIRVLNEKEPFELRQQLNENIAFFQVYPGFHPDRICDVVQADTNGIILDLYNSGTGCIFNGKYNLLEAIRKAAQRKIPIPVFATSQHEGPVDMDIYESSRKLKEAGVVPLADMIKEAAIPKLMWALGAFPDTSQQREALAKLMTTNIAGEISI